MNNIPNENDYTKAFYSDGYRLGMQASQNQDSKSIFFVAIKNLYKNITDLIESLEVFAKNQGQNIDCKKGCAWCCHQPVFALDYELDYLHHFIKENLDKKKQAAIQKRALEKNTQLLQLTTNDLLNAKNPCPLLENDSCLAYDARPMACRIYLSTDVKTCHKFYKNPENKENYPALLDFPMKAGRMMNEGFKAALKTNGIISKEFRIEEKLLTD